MRIASFATLLALALSVLAQSFDSQDGRHDQYRQAVVGLSQSAGNARRLKEFVLLMSDIASGDDRLAGDAAAHLSYVYTFKIPNPRRAFFFANQSAHLGSPRGMHLLAFYLRHGLNGYSKNISLADNFEQEAAENNYLQAQMTMGFKYFIEMKNSTGTQALQMCRKAYEYYQAAGINAESIIRRHHWDDFLSLRELDISDRLSDNIKPQLARYKETMEYYAYEAKHGDGKSAFELWKAYFFGLYGLRRDVTKAMRFLEEAVAAESIPAMAELGRLLTVGNGVDIDLSRGLSLLRFAGDTGDSAALATLGILINRGLFSTNDPSLGTKYLQKAASMGNPEAEHELGQLELLDGRTESAAARFHRSVERGHVRSMIVLSNMYEKGIGVPRSCENAVIFLKRAIEAGPWNEEVRESKRQYIERNPRLSFLLSLLAADEGYEVGQFNGAWLTLRKKYAPPYKTCSTSLDLLSRAYLQSNDKMVTLLLGDAYATKSSRNMTLAAYFYMKASDDGSAVAMCRLASLLSIGAGIPQDDETSLLLLKKSFFLLHEELHGQRLLLKSIEIVLRLAQIGYFISISLHILLRCSSFQILRGLLSGAILRRYLLNNSSKQSAISNANVTLSDR